MSYAFPFGGYVQVPVEQPFDFRGIPVSQSQFSPPVHPYGLPFQQDEFHGLYFHAVDDYDEYAENLTRPRLTKEQVDTLETQFRAHPKPNSETKRQLAIQTNLTLPRVANWFQNRRAKAKQQKRQEEFERMQALAKAERPDRNTDGTAAQQAESNDAGQGQPSDTGRNDNDESDSSTTPTQDRPNADTDADSVLIAQGQHGQNSGNAEPGTVGPQSAQQCSNPTDNTRSSAESPANVHRNLRASNPSCDGNMSQPGVTPPASAAAWAPLSALPLSTSGEIICQPTTLSVSQKLELLGSEPWIQRPGANGTFFPGAVFQNHDETGNEWNQLSTSSPLPNHMSFTEQLFAPFPVPDTIPEHGRDTLPTEPVESSQAAASTTSQSSTTPAVSPGNTDSAPQSQSLPFSRPRERRVDLAARRKRPRPAAIGTAGLSCSMRGPSSMSPTTRLPHGSGLPLRHVKSTQNFSSSVLSPRYPGIRKVSATALRSPLGFPTSLESELSGLPSADLAVPPLVSTTMAPPTPLTPEELQYLMPPTPNDGQYCLSPSQDMACAPWIATTQPLQLHVQSPPTTPLHPTLTSHLQYHVVGGPLPAPARRTAFDYYSISEATRSTQKDAWHCMTMPPENIAPEQSIQMPQPVHISPIPYGDTFSESTMHTGDRLSTHTASPPQALCSVGTSPTIVSSEHTTTPPAPKNTKLLIHSFPEQEDCHQVTFHHLQAHKLDNYTFASPPLNTI